MTTEDVLSAPLNLSYTYTRSTGPVIGAYLAGLRDRRILAARLADGRLLCPPAEYDPHTAAALSDLVEVGPAGVVTAWAWNPQPKPAQPLQQPFAWALVRPDGADTALLAAVAAPGPEA